MKPSDQAFFFCVRDNRFVDEQKKKDVNV